MGLVEIISENCTRPLDQMSEIGHNPEPNA